MTQVYLGLGSNQGDREAHISQAIAALRAHKAISQLRASQYYLSKPVDDSKQPAFVNAAVVIETALSPQALLRLAKHLEAQHQRRYYYHWGPRTLDIDILLYGELEMDSPELTIPHPQIEHRDFVLQPLIELNPSLCLPANRPLAALLPAAPKNIVKAITTVC